MTTENAPAKHYVWAAMRNESEGESLIRVFAADELARAYVDGLNRLRAEAGEDLDYFISRMEVDAEPVELVDVLALGWIPPHHDRAALSWEVRTIEEKASFNAPVADGGCRPGYVHVTGYDHDMVRARFEELKAQELSAVSEVQP